MSRVDNRPGFWRDEYVRAEEIAARDRNGAESGVAGSPAPGVVRDGQATASTYPPGRPQPPPDPEGGPPGSRHPGTRQRASRAFRPFRRSGRDRVIAGVAGGAGEALGIDPVIIRLALVVLAAAGGTGVLLYLGVWMLSKEPEAGVEPTARVTSGLTRTIAVELVLLGALLLLRSGGIWFGDRWVWPVAVAAFGSAIIWSRGSDETRARRAERLPAGASRLLSAPVSPARILLGGLLIAAGMAAFLAANDALAAARNLAFAVAVTLSGAVLILGPAIWRLARQVTEERRDRIRSEERAEVAAHLHDSVLQTLALIQRARSPGEMVSLARGQERELRTWLYRRGGNPETDLLSSAIDVTVTRVERMHGVVIETVVVGDCPLDDGLRAVVGACGEAMTNAARHSGSSDISVYVEAGVEGVTAFVRDHGRGFVPEEVPADRRGIAESIRGRIERNGGRVTIRTVPGEGTEVEMSVKTPQQKDTRK